MDLDTYIDSLQHGDPPEGLAQALLALWHDARGDWKLAHEIAQEEENSAGAWVHAYLHRKEGDASNAAYWYRRARRPFPNMTEKDEWKSIAKELLRDESADRLL